MFDGNSAKSFDRSGGSIAVGRQCRPPIGGNLADDQSAWI
jgi:hypothetical protein